MSRILAKRSSLRKLKLSLNSRLHSSSSSSCSAELAGEAHFLGKTSPATARTEGLPGFRRFGVVLYPRNVLGESNCLKSTNNFGTLVNLRGYASVAEAVVSEDDSFLLGSEEIHELPRAESKKTVAGVGVARNQELRKRQIKMETEAWKDAATEYRNLMMDMCERKLAPNLPYVKSLLLGWFEPLRDAIVADLEMCSKKKFKPNYAEYLEQLPPDMMAVIAMHVMMRMIMTGTGAVGSITVVHAACQIGEAVEHEVRIKRFLEKANKKKNSADNEDKLDPVSGEQANVSSKQEDKLRKKVTQLMKKQKVQQVRKIVKQVDDSNPWGPEGHVKIGSRLLQLLMETAYIQPPVDRIDDAPPDLRPAFVHTLKTIVKNTQKTSRRYGVIECDPIVRKGLEKTAHYMVIPYMPMLTPPNNWKGYDQGAYLFLPSYVMRTHGAKQQREAVKRAPRKKLEPIFEALDALGNTKWRVNKRMLSVIDRIWSTGGSIAGLASREDVPLPEEPDTEDDSEIRNWKWKLKAAKKENRERHSLRCDTELKLVVARKMNDEEGFYYPHNLDFRGRAYPMHPYLNHLGSDLCRGILEFAEGRPLGKLGLRWLKIHLANAYGGGVDKLSYDGRVAFTENHLEDIFDSVDWPIDGQRWWLEAEDPFQCLATCINLTEALRSPSPETTLSHMPVHLDGSCNGLQHYAALGRDKLGAAAVNLVAGEKPADVYSGIAARVLDIISKDAKDDPATNPNTVHARNLTNQVDRKLVKQTVMTSVYGVTYVGARDQIKKRLRERGAFAADDELYAAACYAAKASLKALEEMFEAARSIMSWLGECAKIIASQNQAVGWTTPLGLPVVQPYRQSGRQLVKTSLQSFSLRRETDKVMAMRQRTAFPPNFIHSLDGSHMMMTAVACKKAGLNFAGVHDSYWTHACDVDEMSRILREKFVELYETPILENLLESFEKSFPKLKFPPLPDRGDFDLRDVLESPYFFN